MARKKKKKKVQSNSPSFVNAEATIKALQTQLTDPRLARYVFSGARGVRERILKINYDTLRNTVDKIPLINGIINTRIDQVLPFTTPARDDNDRGYKFELNPFYDGDDKTEDDKEIAQLLRFIDQTGFNYDPEREDDFADFCQMLVREINVIDQVATEIQYNRMGEAIAFWLIDGATIKRVASESDWNKNIRYIQEIEMQVYNKFTADQLVFDYKNKRADIRHRGYGYCLPGYTRILTDQGYQPISKLFEDETLKVWDGDAYREAERVHSDKKQVMRTHFGDGSFIDTSKDHRFKVIEKDGSIGWKAQEELLIDDYVVAYKAVATSIEVQDPVLGVDIAELLGWLYSDGTWSTRDTGYGYWRLYYNTKDQVVADRHDAILKSWSNGKSQCWKTNATGKNTWDSKGTTLYLGVTEYIRPFLDLGFTPDDFSVMTRMPVIEIQAFLRGVFSANGHVSSNYRPILSDTNETHIRQIQLLLHQLGIDTVLYCIKRKDTRNDIWRLVVLSVGEFRDQVGFIHKYKTHKLLKWRVSTQRKLTDRIPLEHVKYLLTDLDLSGLTKEDRHVLRKIQAGTDNRTKTFSWLAKRGFEFDYRLKRVVNIEVIDAKVQMYDLRILNGKSQFVAEGVYVHNSPVEMAIDVITTLLFGYNYIRDQLVKDRMPKGFISVMGDIGKPEMDAIRNYWYSAMSGAGGQWNIPILPSGKEGIGIDFKNMGQNNKDMEYHKTMMFISSLVASIYSIDLAELGIKTDNSTSVIGENLQPRIENSKDRGLQSTLMFIQQYVNKIVRKVTTKYNFKFVGIVREDQTKKAELRSKQISGYKTIDEVREEDGLEPFNEDWSKMPLNPQAVQIFMGAQAGGEEGYEGEEGYGEYEEEAPESEPIEKSLKEFHKRTDKKVKVVKYVIE